MIYTYLFSKKKKNILPLTTQPWICVISSYVGLPTFLEIIMEAEDELSVEEITGDENEKTGLGIHAKANQFEIFLTSSKENLVFQERNF